MPAPMAPTVVQVQFSCPLCAAPQQTQLIALSRAGFHTCSACGRKLKAAQVSHAIHAGPPIRAPRAPPTHDTLPGVRTRIMR